MYFFTGFKIDTVDDAVRVDVFAVGVGADEDFTALEIPGKLPRRFVRRARVNVRAFRKALSLATGPRRGLPSFITCQS